jgi:hypothetical protein
MEAQAYPSPPCFLDLFILKGLNHCNSDLFILKGLQVRFFDPHTLKNLDYFWGLGSEMRAWFGTNEKIADWYC